MKILFFSISNSSFIKKDLELLRKKYHVKTAVLRNFFGLVKDVLGNDVMFLWFASINFFFPLIFSKLAGKKIIIVAGGYDVADVPSINYGSLVSPVKRFVVLLMFRAAHRIIAVSRSNFNELLKYYPLAEKKTSLIYHGFKPEYSRIPKKNKSILTIGHIDKSSYLRKGFDRFLAAAEAIPNVEFHHIGKINSGIKLPQYPNIIYHGFVSDETFIKITSEAMVYLQLSRHEGFGCSVAEAMQLGCIPVVSDAYALPEVAGECGSIIRNPDDISTVRNEILRIMDNYQYENSIKCRERVNKEFSWNKRERKIYTLLEEL
jgi:glycosyltransferase involved in cell wall biosynthesis